ncbi:MAG: glutathione S-transferase family protein [Betaproteobacteria bacterium]|nr:glutathione S-transferase family protein [Betaproteobacteria bacterium]MDH5220296.1 glutathione S-transferase family protein [Betaproteobacteria bacterium]MDH5351113.1 glutathione S-transferase family protein [Betaproteobacteria bacterium]
MIDLYAAGTSNGMRARIALEETGLAYTFHPVALDKGEHKTPQFLAMNPNGQIPVIVDRDGPGGKPLTLSQSTAILMYCAEKSGKFIPRDPAARAAMLEALMVASTDVTPIFGAYFGIARSKEPHAPSMQLFKERLRALFEVWDQKLARHRYAAGDEVTIADFSLYAGYARIKGVAADLFEGLANVARWGGEMAARPGVKKATGG